MGRILSLILGLAVISLLAYKVVYGRSFTGQNGTETPKQALDNVHQTANRIEADSAKRAEQDLSAGTKDP